ncbi:MYND-type domain-containing protein [Mycena sanguinolenta]|uniref:MYND-type domain-containing protein n=1 Tax=Mycena sanguinolenta TaxID=230812 RepID=A0A8H7DN39_9AGAR|nr:MYND-type domain-containing protein [Mycena sanguinolenta]
MPRTHPSLDLSSISRLPAHLRTRATAAASGSSEETLSLLDGLPDIAKRHLSSLLPVFYAGLDVAPSRISEVLAKFDSSGWSSIQPQIMQVHRCLRGLLYLAASKVIPRTASVDIWHNLWPWIEFLDEYDECLPSDGLPDVVTRYDTFISLIRFLHDEDNDAAARKVIDPTPGLYIVIGRAWRHFILAGHEDGITDVSHFFELGKWNSTFHTQDLIIGVGGRANLASTIVSHITHLLPGPDSDVTQQSLFALTGTVYMVDNHGDAALKDALLSSGIITALTTATRTLCRSTFPLSRPVLGGFFSVMVKHISSYSPALVVESLRAGLLETVFISPVWLSVFSSCLLFLLKDLLPGLTVYHSVLMQLQTSLPKVRDRDPAIIGDEALLAHWKSFITLAESRLRILNKYNTGALTRMRVCDNLKCGRNRLKQELKRCGGCLSAFYCSETCQANDWRHGGHRHGCHELSLRRDGIGPFYVPSCTALLYHEFALRRAKIADHHRLFALQYPSRPPCIRFDFSTGACMFQLWPLDDEPLGSDFKFDVERARRSGGQLQLHLMKVVHEGDSRFWPFLSYVKSGNLVYGPAASA